MLKGYEHLVGGVSGGIASTMACHPLDLLRIRYSADEGRPNRPHYRSYTHAAREIVRVDGVRGLYQGLSPSIIAAPLSWGLYFHIYHKLHDGFGLQRDDPSFIHNLGLGCASGSAVMAVTNPLWVAKTRLCLQYENHARAYNGLLDCLRKIWIKEGIRGYYKGFVPGLFGTVNGSIQFATYNFMKDERTKFTGQKTDAHLAPGWYLLFSSMSKIIATVATFPYQVLRTRLQDHNIAYKGLVDCSLSTWRQEGIHGFYKGMFMATLKQLPTAIITYMVYEYARRIASTL